MKNVTQILLLLLAASISRLGDAACACKASDYVWNGCHACPASLWDSCGGNFASNIDWGGCNILGCRLKCQCSNPCRCLEPYNCKNAGDSAASCVETSYPDYTCACSAGYVLNSAKTCVDYNACASHSCNSFGDSAATCVDNAPPSTGYTCSCSFGYHFQGGSCVDIDSCGSSNPCAVDGDSSATCNDLPAPDVGFTCSCSSGYAPEGTSCVNVDGCLSNPCSSNGDTSSTCSDKSPPLTGNTCSCSTGFAASSTGGGAETCVDIDACVNNPCDDSGDSTAICYDSAPPSTSYSCGCTSGYTFDGTTCVDEDFCENNPCDNGGDLEANCTDLAPSSNSAYECNCSTGYHFQAGTCVDRDSCGSGDNPCAFSGDTAAVCNDLPPPAEGFTCTCSSSAYEPIGSDCTDVDGCSNDPCSTFGDSSATCADNEAPLTGNTCACTTGYEVSQLSNNVETCVDRDECVGNPCSTVGGDAGATCFDKAAPETGYTCSCSTEAYSFDGTACVDFDGCTSNPCNSNGDASATCTDATAPMTGNTCSCSTGYSVFHNGGGAETCMDIDACTGNPCNSYDSGATCFDNAAPSTTYTCGCTSGYVFDGTTCVDDDACTPVNRCTIDNDVNATCIDAPPGTANNLTYTCNCSFGFEPKLNATACRPIPGESSSSGSIDPSSPSGMAMIVGLAVFVVLVVAGFLLYRRRTKKSEALANSMLKRAEHELQTVHASREFDEVDIFGATSDVVCDIPDGNADDVEDLKKRQKELERENQALRDDNSKHKKRLEKSDLYSSRRDSIPRMATGFEEEPDIDEL